MACSCDGEYVSDKNQNAVAAETHSPKIAYSPGYVDRLVSKYFDVEYQHDHTMEHSFYALSQELYHPIVYTLLGDVVEILDVISNHRDGLESTSRLVQTLILEAKLVLLESLN